MGWDGMGCMIDMCMMIGFWGLGGIYGGFVSVTSGKQDGGGGGGKIENGEWGKWERKRGM